MSTNSPVTMRLLATAGFLSMAAAGWQLAAGSGATAAKTGPGITATAKAESRSKRTVRNSGPPEHVRKQLEAVRNAGDPRERMRATISLANSIPVSELGEWIDKRWFESVPGFDLTLFNKIANQRWRLEDPEGHLRWAIKSNSGTAGETIQAWISTDPSRALSFLKENPNPSMYMRALGELAKGDPGTAIAQFRELLATAHISQSYGYQVSEFLRQLASKSPAALTASLDKLPVQWRTQAEAALVGQALKNDFTTEFRKLWERADGLALFQKAQEGVSGLGDKVLAEIGEMPESWLKSIGISPNLVVNEANARKWISADLEGAGFSPQDAAKIRASALQRIMYPKPEDALRLLGDIEVDGSLRENLIRNLFSYGPNLAKGDQLLALLTREEDLAIARTVIEKSKANGSDQSQPRPETPSDWLEKAGSIDLNSGQAYNFARILREWDKDKLARLSSEFHEMPAEKKVGAARLMANVGEALDPHLKGDAISYLMARPLPAATEEGQIRPYEDPARLASTHAVMWGLKDPEAAGQWIQSLPDGDGKLWAQKNFAANWANYDPEAADRWVSSLPSSARAEVKKFIKK
jgi:hypothetical protein